MSFDEIPYVVFLTGAETESLRGAKGDTGAETETGDVDAGTAPGVLPFFSDGARKSLRGAKGDNGMVGAGSRGAWYPSRGQSTSRVPAFCQIRGFPSEPRSHDRGHAIVIRAESRPQDSAAVIGEDPHDE